MMKTYWVLSKNPSDDMTLNPLQKNKLFSHRKHPLDSALASVDDKVGRRYSSSSPPIPRFSSSKETTPTPNRTKSISPDDWPAMNRSMADHLPVTTIPEVSPILLSSLTGILKDREAIDLSPSHSSVPQDLMVLASQNMSTIREFERLAEENAQNARTLANWAHYIVQQQTTPSSPNNDQSKISMPPLQRATVATVTKPHPLLGSSVDIDDGVISNNTKTPSPTVRAAQRNDCVIT